MKSGFVYILECSDGSFYTGSTANLESRVIQHQLGEGCSYTQKRLPVKLVFVQEFDSLEDAYYAERRIHGWSRKKKLAIINGEYDQLPDLSKAYCKKTDKDKDCYQFDPSTGSGSEL